LTKNEPRVLIKLFL